MRTYCQCQRLPFVEGMLFKEQLLRSMRWRGGSSTYNKGKNQLWKEKSQRRTRESTLKEQQPALEEQQPSLEEQQPALEEQNQCWRSNNWMDCMRYVMSSPFQSFCLLFVLNIGSRISIGVFFFSLIMNMPCLLGRKQTSLLGTRSHTFTVFYVLQVVVNRAQQ